MRKLVKKLALVLALVLALGCIAPASAQAAEVRRSWNFAPDAYKPTYSMTVGDDYSFELYDQGDAIDPSIYDVAYYSKSDALAMSKSTGYAVAVAAAEGVKICAVVTNKVTGNTAKVWGLVDIAAKVVETTPEVTPTVEVTPEATPTEAPFALVAAEQYSKNQILLTFNDEATKDNVKKTDLSVKYSLTEGSVAKRGCYIKGDIAFNGNNTAVVTFWQDFKDDTFAYVSFQDSTAIEFPISVGQLSDIEILTTEVSPEDENANITIRLIDENGVTLERVKLNNLPEGDDYEIALTLDDEDDDEIAELNDDETGVYISEIGYAVFVEIFYETVDKDDEDVELYAAGQIVAADMTPVIVGEKWVVTDTTDKNKINYNSDVRLCMDDVRYIKGLLTVKIPELGKDIADVAEATKKTTYDDPFKSLKYETSDKNVVLIDASGKLVPVSTGTAEIIISYPDIWDEDAEEWILGDVIGVKEVTIEPARKLTSLTTDGAEKAKNAPTLSTKSTADDTKTVKIYGKDQYGETYKLTAKDHAIKVVQSEDTSGTKFTDIVANGYVEPITYHKDGYAVATFLGYNGTSAKSETYEFEFRTGDDVLATKSVYIKYDTTTRVADTYKLLANPTKSEVKTQNESKMADDQDAKIFKIVAWSYKKNIKLETVNIEGIYNPNVEKTTGNSFWFGVTVPNGENAEAVANAVVVSGSELYFDPLKNRNENTDSAWEPKAWTKGTYTFTLYKYDKDGEDADSVASVTVEIADGHKGTSTKVESTESTWEYAEVMSGTSLASGAGSFYTKTTGCALFEAILKSDKNDTDYCIILKDDSTEIFVDTNEVENVEYEVTKIEGYANGKDIIVITKITYKKTYVENGQKTVKTLTSTVSEGSITFGVEEE